MTSWTLIRRSLGFHARAHLGVVLGAAIGSAALIGALLVGDSVRGSLRDVAESRVGIVDFVINAQDRLFQASLQQRLQGAMRSHISVSEALVLPGVAAKQDGSARANQVSVIGIDPQTWPRFVESNRRPTTNSRDEESEWLAGRTAFVNETLAHQLDVRPGDEIVLRVRKPSVLGMDAAISPHNESSVALRLKVGGIWTPAMFGDFSLASQPAPPANLFLPMALLAEKVGYPGKANLIIADSEWDSAAAEKIELETDLNNVWQLEDAGLNVRVIEQPTSATGGETLPPAVEVASSRIFLDPTEVNAAMKARGELPATEVLTYLVNLIRAGGRSTPYSIVTAANGPYVPDDLSDEEILLNEWLADDLKVGRGDAVELSYFLVDSGSRLVERTNVFKVREIVPMTGVHADRTLMPEFPGLAKAESTHDWDAGFPLVYPIRDKDEAYWKQYRGTPKAFISLAAGQAMWTNRFGALTAVRYAVPTNSTPKAVRDAVYDKLRASLTPDEVGLTVQAARATALRGATESQDFGQLFLGFSFFLVLAALLLMALLFQFGLEQRAQETGTMLAVGFAPKQVRRLLLFEGAMPALIGGMLGVIGGLVYARLMLLGLTTVWRGAVGTSRLQFHVTPVTIVVGLSASTIVAVITIWITLRKQAKQPARELLAGETKSPSLKKRSRGKWIGIASGMAAVGIIGWAMAAGQRENAGAFFGAGALLLIAGLAQTSAWLARLARAGGWREFTLLRLGIRGCARRRTRSVATVALLASGCFVIVAIGVFRLDANRDAARRDSGTGGFALMGESSLPVVKDLNTNAGREQFGVSDQDMVGVAVVPFRVRSGDEASCLNLNRALKPRLLGVKPELLAGRFTFGDAARGLDVKKGWELLETSTANADEAIPAIGDANAIEWAMGKKLGDTIDYTDESGRTFKVRLVGALANSILQGSLIIDEAEFVKKFPGESGYRMFLIDAPSNSISQVSATLSRALQDQGVELTPATERLEAFNAVQNTYLGTFQILGGLGLLLGSAGLGVVALRNVLERRGELGLLTAAGFRKPALQRLVLIEHGALLILGLGIGIAAAVIAVLPALSKSGAGLPYASLGVTLGAVLLNGGIWTWLAVKHALKGNPLEALRNE